MLNKRAPSLSIFKTALQTHVDVFSLVFDSARDRIVEFLVLSAMVVIHFVFDCFLSLDSTLFTAAVAFKCRRQTVQLSYNRKSPQISQ